MGITDGLQIKLRTKIMKMSINANLKRGSLIFLFTFLPPANLAFSAGKNLEMFTDRSEYLRVTFDKKQKAYSARWSNELKRAYQSSPEHFRITASKHPECPSKVWWSTWPKANKYKSQEADRSLIANIKKDLKGFPAKTIKKCTELSPIFTNGSPTNHWRNKTFFSVIPATLVIKDKSNGAIDVFRSLVQTNYLDRTSSKVMYIYNENLQKTCTFKEISNNLSSAHGSCTGIGSGKATGEITNVMKGEFTMTFFTTKASIFVTNLTPERAQKKFPNAFE